MLYGKYFLHFISICLLHPMTPIEILKLRINKYLGLLKKLSSPEFVNDLAIMCDVLQELSNFSIELQSHAITLIQAEQSIKRCIRVITSFKTDNGDYICTNYQAVVAIKDMKFKNIDLTSNKKMIIDNHK